MYDIIIRNGKIIDGTGNPWFLGDLAVQAGKIKKVGYIPTDVLAHQIIDAAGQIVAPGFIDIHSHSDIPLLIDGLAQGKVRQGVTTEVIGNCGFGIAPLNTEMAKKDVQDSLDIYGSKLSWQNLDEYLNLLETKGVSLHVVPLIGHGVIRKSIMNYDQRQPTSDELAEMCQLVRECMEAGAFGLTTGLIYPPSSYAESKELVELAKIVAEYGGFYATHMRNESSEVYRAVEESINIGRQARLPIHISHHKVCHPQFWGIVDNTLALMHEVRKTEGIDVTCDLYPYIATNTGLAAVIPDEYHAGGKEVLLTHLKNPDLRETLLSNLESTQGPRGWENLFISEVRSDKNQTVEGKDVKTIAQEWNTTPAQVVIKLLIEEELAVGMIRFAMCEEDVKRVMQDDLTMIGSDGLALAIEGPLSKGKPHPRNFGTFPRVLGKYSRDEGVLSLEDAIKKMSSFPAQRLGLLTKGILREGMDADITIFNPETIKDQATFSEPHQYPTGIDYVIVNGQIVIKEGEHTGIKPGKVLRKQR